MTLRWRLTLLYGFVFMLCGGLLLGVAYLLVRQALEGQSAVPTKVVAVGPVSATDTVTLTDGRVISVAQYHAELAADIARSQAASAAYHAVILRAMLTRGGAALAVVTPAALALGWIAAGQGLSPLHRVTRMARHIAREPTAEGLRTRIAPHGPHDEVRQLAEAFDAMLVRLDAAFGAQRRFVANAAHEMRTPLAIERSLLEVGLAGPDADVATIRQRLLDANRRQSDLLNALLALARAEQAQPDRRPMAFDAVVAAELSTIDVCETRIHEEIGPVQVAGEPSLLPLLVRNVVGNAVRYNVPGGSVHVVVARDNSDTTLPPGAGVAMLRVENTGPTVAAERVPELFEPFRRGATDRTQADSGAGLGLSIVRAVAQAHDGTVTAIARPEGGLVVTVRLPALP